MVVEFLTFAVPLEIRDQWMAVEHQTWSRFLERQPGFVDKQLWVDRDDEDAVHAVVRWTDESSWKSIPDHELAAVDEAMGSFRRAPTARVYDVLAEVESAAAPDTRRRDGGDDGSRPGQSVITDSARPEPV
jgi:uncharacterized protein (TIGR03792 family)